MTKKNLKVNILEYLDEEIDRIITKHPLFIATNAMATIVVLFIYIVPIMNFLINLPNIIAGYL